MAVITLISRDQKELKVEITHAKKSKVIRQMIEDFTTDPDFNDPNDEMDKKVESIPIPNVDHSILEKIMEWCK